MGRESGFRDDLPRARGRACTGGAGPARSARAAGRAGTAWAPDAQVVVACGRRGGRRGGRPGGRARPTDGQRPDNAAAARPGAVRGYGADAAQRRPVEPRDGHRPGDRDPGTVADTANQHIMGWGALNPAPMPGERDWGSLDARMRFIAKAGVKPVITLCCARTG